MLQESASSSLAVPRGPALLFWQLVYTDNVVASGSIRCCCALERSSALDALQLSRPAGEAESALCAQHVAIFHGCRTLDANIHLVAIVHGPDDVTEPGGASAFDIIEVGAVVFFGLGAGDFHRLGPCTLAFGDR